MSAIERPTLLRLSTVAQRLNVSLSTVYQLASSGELPVIATGAGGKGFRVSEEDLEAFIDQRRTRCKVELPTEIRHLRLEPSSRGRRGTSDSARASGKSSPK
jgi:excisionase family DNA binding protein